MEHRVKISDEQAELMTLDKEGDATHLKRRRELLLKVARVARKLGQFHMATKKFTQAGERVKAMKALLQSGDTERVIFFATVSRSREIYVLAANYLQSLDWHNDPEVMKAIIQFYSKARAYDALSRFYEACAQLEIDEFRDYQKALGALREARKCVAKSTRAEDKDARAGQLQRRIALVEQFIHARQLARSTPEEMVRLCFELLEQADLEQALRAGDVYAALVEHHVQSGNWQQAHRTIERMRHQAIILGPYLDDDLVRRVYQQVGQQPPELAEGRGGGGRGSAGATADADADEVEDEEVVDEEEEDGDVQEDAVDDEEEDVMAGYGRGK